MCLSECGRFSSSESEILPTVKFAAHHRDLERNEIIANEVLCVIACMRFRPIVENDLQLRTKFGEHRLLDRD